jgi:hypothetical protein
MIAREQAGLRAATVAPEWPAVGDVVVDWNRSRGFRMVVKRITKTMVVASTGKTEYRYRRDGLRRVGAGAWDGSTLIRSDDERWLRYERHSTRVSIAVKVEDAMVRFRRDDDDAAAHEALALLAGYAQLSAPSEDQP